MLVSNVQLLLELLHLGHLLLLARRRLALGVARSRCRTRGLVLVGALQHACYQISSAQNRPYTIPSGSALRGRIRTVSFLARTLLRRSVLSRGPSGRSHLDGSRRRGSRLLCVGRLLAHERRIVLPRCVGRALRLGEGLGEVLRVACARIACT